MLLFNKVVVVVVIIIVIIIVVIIIIIHRNVFSRVTDITFLFTMFCNTLATLADVIDYMLW